MYRFIETIQVREGIACNLFYHNKRMGETLSMLRREEITVDLGSHLHLSPDMKEVKCRVVYAWDGIKEITYTPYTLRQVNTLRLIEDNEIDYHLKSVDRSRLECLFARRGMQDDVLIVKDNLLTDTSVANIALYDGKHWLTPYTPLLKGTKRALLLEKNIIQESEIRKEDLPSFSSVRLFNAMIDWGVLEIQVKDIYE